MKLTKRILSGLLSAGMILSLTACDEEPAYPAEIPQGTHRAPPL